jgi:hypothetical protein
MKNKFCFFRPTRTVAVRGWMWWAPILLLPIDLLLPTLFEPESVAYMVQLIAWIINVLFFMFILALIIKDNAEVRRDNGTGVSLLESFVIVMYFLQFLILYPILKETDKFIEIMSFVN